MWNLDQQIIYLNAAEGLLNSQCRVLNQYREFILKYPEIKPGVFMRNSMTHVTINGVINDESIGLVFLQENRYFNHLALTSATHGSTCVINTSAKVEDFTYNNYLLLDKYSKKLFREIHNISKASDVKNWKGWN